MAEAKILRIYLDPVPLNRARNGNFGVLNVIRASFQAQGFRVEYCRNGEAERLKSASRRGYSLFLMDEPFHPRALTLRRAYYYPFWRIENTARRWEFQVAQKAFYPDQTDPVLAQNWANDWRKWLFKGAAAAPVNAGFIYVPLQGRLLDHRSFQTMSPIEMIRAVLEHDATRPVRIGLHPGEAYSDAERAALDELCGQSERVSLQTGGMEAALRDCDYVVTENSSAALSGFFFHKPAILFARIDFHHIAVNVCETGVGPAFARVMDVRPDFDRYLHWFIMQNAIKADADDAPARILATVRGFGWEI